MIDLLVSKWVVMLLVLVRVLGMFSLAPFWSGEGAPMVVKIGLAAAASIAIFPDVMSRNVLPSHFDTTFQFGFAVMEQAAIGMIIGYVASMFFSIFESSAKFYDTQMGLGIINVLDPFHATESSVMGQVQSFTALLMFLAIDGPHQLLFAVYKSFKWVPHLDLTTGLLPKAIFALLTKLFYVAIIFVMPMLGVLLITHVILGILSKASPQLNVMILGFSINFAVGLITFIWVLDYYQNLIPEIFFRMFDELDLLMAHVM